MFPWADTREHKVYSEPVSVRCRRRWSLCCLVPAQEGLCEECQVYLAKKFNGAFYHSISNLSHSSMCFYHGKNELGCLLYYIANSLIIQPETTAIIHLTLSIMCTYTDFLNCNPVTLRQYMKLYITYNLNQLQKCNIYLSYPVYPITFTRIYNSISYIFHSRLCYDCSIFTPAIVYSDLHLSTPYFATQTQSLISFSV